MEISFWLKTSRNRFVCSCLESDRPVDPLDRLAVGLAGSFNFVLRCLAWSSLSPCQDSGFSSSLG